MDFKTVIESPRQVIYLQQRGIADITVDGDKVQVNSGMPEYNSKFTISAINAKIDELNDFVSFINSFAEKDDAISSPVEDVEVVADASSVAPLEQLGIQG